jgi:hypothetical protein
LMPVSARSRPCGSCDNNYRVLYDRLFIWIDFSDIRYV